MKSRFPRRHGAALIITLAMIAMMTFLVVAFFSRTLSNLQVETASTGTMRADLLARSAGGIIVSDFRTEIIAGSTVLGSGSQPPVYVPLAPNTASTPPIFPSQPAVSRYGSLPTYNATFNNLVKQSTGRFFPNVAPYNSNLKPIIQTVTGVTTDVVSPNGRTVINNRWDLPPGSYTVASSPPLYPSGLGPQLLVNAAGIGYSQFYTSTFLPHWVMMTRDGVPAIQDSATIPASWKDYTPTNPNAAIGRFAYNIYNVGGLLDVNAVGYDESVGAVPLAAVGQKGTPAFAKLSVIPGMGSSPDVNATAFAKTWRNLASGSSSDNYLAYLGFTRNATNVLLTANPFFSKGPVTGFLQTAVGTASSDNHVLGRQDLIRLATKLGAPYGLTATSLPYLTHFSREVNAPSWTPTQNAGGTGGLGGNNGNGLPAPYAYLTNKDNPAVPNRCIPNVRVGPNPIPGGWRRLTGEYAVEGEPLVKYRFPLSWLLVLQAKDPTSSKWDLTDEARVIVQNLNARNIANGGPGLKGSSDEDRAADMVQRAFGLVWAPTDTPSPNLPYPSPSILGAHWNYTGNVASPTSPVAEKIALLGDFNTPPPSTNPATPVPVTRDNREPNFFELLKAGILSGSLGNASDFESMCVNAGEDSNADYQVMQIGANMIDQADSDSYPTKIVFGYRFDNPASIVSPRAPLYASGNTTPYTNPKEVKVISGVEDLPYIYTFLSTPYRIPAGETVLSGMPMPALPPGTVPTQLQSPQRDALDAWLQFVLWKPQQKAVATIAPSKFRIVYSGTNIHLTIFGDGPPYNNFAGVDFKYKDSSPILTSPASAPDKFVTFTDAIDDFRTPTLLGGMSAESPPGSGYSPYPSVKPPNDFDCSQLQGKGYHPAPANASAPVPLPRGLWLGEMYRPEKSPQLTNPAPKGYSYSTAPETRHSEFRCDNDSKFELQYDQDGNGHWRTYQRYDRFAVGTGPVPGPYAGRNLYGFADQLPYAPLLGSPVYPSTTTGPAYKTLDISTLAISAVDPRSHRYGLLASSVGDNSNVIIWPNNSAVNWKYYLKQGWAPKPNSTYYMTFGPNSTDARFSPNWTGGPSINPWASHSTDNIITNPESFWTDNSTTSVFCKDPDLVQRRADGDYTNAVRPVEQTLATGYTLPTTPSTAARSQDLGRVLNRPFRSVGELGYVFRDDPYKSINLFTDKSADSALLDLFSVTEQPAVVAGKVNLNTRNPEVIQAVIIAASREEQSTTNVISLSEASTIAQNLVANTIATSGTNVGPILNPAEIANRLEKIMPTTSGDQHTTIKAQREVVGRALAGSGQTRTWNFLVDIIAQSGRFAPNASAPAQFTVEGEKRYWLHVAIDRTTGQVIDQQLEPVME